MSWISDIAGKAEELLNKIDQNAAVVLKKDKNSPNIRKKIKKKSDQENEYVKLSEESARGSNELHIRSSQSSPAISSNSYHHYPDLLDSTINHEETMVTESERSDKLILLDKANITEDVRELLNENVMLKNEIRTLNNEVSLLLSRVKESDKDNSNLVEKFNKSEAESVVLNQELNEISDKLSKAEYQYNLLQLENERFRNLASDNENSQVLKLQQEITELQLKSQRQEEVLLNKIVCLEKRLGLSENQLAESESERKKALEELRIELEQYRSKAHLQALELDKYRASATLQPNDSLQENLSEQCSKLREELENSRYEYSKANDKLDSSKKEISNLQLELTTFRDRALSAERIQRNLKQELETSKIDMMDQLSKVTENMKEKENELRQAKSELVARRSQDTWQSRVANLTSALVRKQAALEQASTESAQLRLQLEKTKNKCREYSQQMQMSRSVNDTDDVKAQVPLIFMESPFDRGLTRRIKQVYSAMDSVAARLSGVLLRRYPFARIVVLLYMILLHSIICLVLYSWTPDTK